MRCMERALCNIDQERCLVLLMTLVCFPALLKISDLRVFRVKLSSMKVPRNVVVVSLPRCSV